ncbi:MAG: hypothetical protein OXC63_09235 [Aestuariivita sp.]|nr:hypothetical protein [Aestuariivita sp.]MCY4347272.1 hypothetical protein [Aestuariivita sp.]
MRRIFLILTFALASCVEVPLTTRAVLNLDYASTSLGFRNSGALSAGRLFLWDQTDQTLVNIQSDIDLPTRPATNPVTLEASSVQGVTISASVGLTDDVHAEIASEVQSNIAFKVEDVVRLNNFQVHNGLSSAYRNLQASGVNAEASWRIRDSIDDRKRFSYVLIADEITASSESVTYRDSSSDSTSLTVFDSAIGEKINVEIPSYSTAKCSGEKVTCYFNVRVFKVRINKNGNLDYHPHGYNKTELVEAFRKL